MFLKVQNNDTEHITATILFMLYSPMPKNTLNNIIASNEPKNKSKFHLKLSKNLFE